MPDTDPFPNIEHKGAEFSGADMSKALFNRVNLSGASFYALLENAKFAGSNLAAVEFDDANLGGALFYNVDLGDSKLSHVNLSDAKIDNANLAKLAVIPDRLDIQHQI